MHADLKHEDNLLELSMSCLFVEWFSWSFCGGPLCSAALKGFEVQIQKAFATDAESFGVHPKP